MKRHFQRPSSHDHKGNPRFLPRVKSCFGSRRNQATEESARLSACMTVTEVDEAIETLYVENENLAAKIDRLMIKMRKAIQIEDDDDEARAGLRVGPAVGSFDLLHSNLTNSKKQLEYTEHEYLQLRRRFKRMKRKPHSESVLASKIMELDDAIHDEKQLQVETIQNSKRVDRLQNKAITLLRAGGHTDKVMQTDKILQIGGKYQQLLREFKLV